LANTCRHDRSSCQTYRLRCELLENVFAGTARGRNLEKLIADPKSGYHGDKKAINDPDEYRSAGAFIVPEAARWDSIVKIARADDIKVPLDDILELLEKKYPDKLRGLLPRFYAGSNLGRENVTGLINLFSKDIFKAEHGAEDLLGRVYEYFIGEFASSEGKRGGEYFTPPSIVRLLIAREKWRGTQHLRSGLWLESDDSRGGSCSQKTICE
jgi:type I restriction enzyme M protein